MGCRAFIRWAADLIPKAYSAINLDETEIAPINSANSALAGI